MEQLRMTAEFLRRHGYISQAEDITRYGQGELAAGHIPPSIPLEVLKLEDRDMYVAVPVHFDRPVGKALDLWQTHLGIPNDELKEKFGFTRKHLGGVSRWTPIRDDILLQVATHFATKIAPTGTKEVFNEEQNRKVRELFGALVTRHSPQEAYQEDPATGQSVFRFPDIITDPSRTVGDTVKAWVDYTGTSQAHLGRKLGYDTESSRSKLSEFSNNHKRRPFLQDKEIQTIASVLRIPAGIIIARKFPQDFNRR